MALNVHSAADSVEYRFGVSRVYDRQCGYVLGDAQQMQASMRQLLKSAKNSGSELDLAAGQTR